LGRATLDGGTSGTAYTLLAFTSITGCEVFDFIIQNNGATSTAAATNLGSLSKIVRCVVNSIRGSGFSTTSSTQLIECEAYSCNQSNSSNTAGFFIGGTGAIAKRCISHDNTTANGIGFILGTTSGGHLSDCIADSNGSHGIAILARNNSLTIRNCDSYNNGGDGIRIDLNTNPNGFFFIENCNLIKNGGYGVNNVEVSLAHEAYVINCGFGSGTQANTSGTVASNIYTQESGSITYAADVTPWNDPTTGDFRISLAAAKGTGRGAFTQTAASYTGTVAYPDVGAAQHQDSGGSGGVTVSSPVYGPSGIFVG
jgi:hypothetical protein